MRESSPQFPVELLNQPPEARKTIFQETKWYLHLSSAIRCYFALVIPIAMQIVMVIGAPGVGKTTVRKAMVRDLTTAFLAQPESSRTIPCRRY